MKRQATRKPWDGEAERRCPYCKKRMDYVGEISQNHEGFLVHVWLCRDVVDCGCRMELSRSPNNELLRPVELAPYRELSESQLDELGFSVFTHPDFG